MPPSRKPAPVKVTMTDGSIELRKASSFRKPAPRQKSSSPARSREAAREEAMLAKALDDRLERD